MALSPNVVVVAPGDLITSVHLNNIRANLDRLDTSKASLAGATFTGAVGFNGSAVSIARAGSTRPAVSFYADTAFTNRQAAVVGADTGLELTADVGQLRVIVGATDVARFDQAVILFGKAAGDIGTAGAEINMNTAKGRIASTIGVANINMQQNHIAAADVAGVAFTRFERGGSAIGSISQVATTGVAYNTTSDERLKTVVAPADPDDALAKVAAMNPVRFTWNAAPDAGEQIGFIAQQLNTVAPEAVTEGTGAPGDVAADESGGDGFVPWMTDLSKLVPTLVAAIQGLTAKVAALEAAA